MKRVPLSLLALAILFAAGPLFQARASSDPIADATDNLFSIMLGDNRADASLLLTALRSTRDPALIPVFSRIAQRTEPELQLGGMVAVALAAKDPARLNLDLLLKCPNQLMATATLSMLIDENLISNDQLTQILTASKDSAQRVMAASELSHRKALPDPKPLMDLAADPLIHVRYFAAFALLESANPAENKLGLDTLNNATWPADQSARYNPRDVPTQGMIVLRIRKDKITPGIPWIVALAQDEKIDSAVRYAAVETLLELQRSEGPAALSMLIANPPNVMSKKIRLALMALQFAGQLKPGVLTPLENGDSRLLQNVVRIAQKAAGGADVSSDIVKLINEGQPFIMDWALMWAESAPPARQILLRKALIENSAIVDEMRGRDFERAVIAAEKIASENTPAGRGLLKQFMHSDNRAIVEAALAGIYRSNTLDQADIVMEFWTRFQEHQTSAYENSANYAALVLAREGKPAAKSWLGGMVQGGSVQDLGFRVLAGWYYAKLTGQADALAKRFAERK